MVNSRPFVAAGFFGPLARGTAIFTQPAVAEVICRYGLVARRLRFGRDRVESGHEADIEFCQSLTPFGHSPRRITAAQNDP